MKSPSPLELADDLHRRRAAQAALLFPGIDPDEISEVKFGDDGEQPILEIVLSRPISRWADITVRSGNRLIATRESVVDWMPGHAAEYRRQYDPVPTGSFFPRLTIHPDQVDLWMKQPVPLAELDGHRTALNYTGDDDGMWMDCECGERISLGFSPSIPAVFAAMSEHTKAVTT